MATDQTLKRAAQLLRQDCLREVGSDEVSQVATKLEAIAAQMGGLEVQKPPYTCKLCGAPSWVDPFDQEAPPDYCHESDHGEPPEQETQPVGDVIEAVHLVGFGRKDVGKDVRFDHSLPIGTELYTTPPDAAKRIAELEAELTEARKDAERYRWLRHGDNDEVVMQRGPVDMTYHWLPRRERLDAIIDAAIAKRPPTASPVDASKSQD